MNDKQIEYKKTLTDYADVKRLFMFLNSRSEKAKTQRMPSTPDPGPTKETKGKFPNLSNV